MCNWACAVVCERSHGTDEPVAERRKLESPVCELDERRRWMEGLRQRNTTCRRTQSRCEHLHSYRRSSCTRYTGHCTVYINVVLACSYRGDTRSTNLYQYHKLVMSCLVAVPSSTTLATMRCQSPLFSEALMSCVGLTLSFSESHMLSRYFSLWRPLALLPSMLPVTTKFSRLCLLNTCPRKASCRWRRNL